MNQAAALRIAFAGMVALGVAVGIGRFAFTPLLPLMQVDAGLCVAAGAHVVQLNAAMTAAFALGQILGPLTASLMLEASWRFTSGLVLASALLVISGVMLWRSPRAKR